MPPRWNENRLTAKLGIDYPVIHSGAQPAVKRKILK